MKTLTIETINNKIEELECRYYELRQYLQILYLYGNTNELITNLNRYSVKNLNLSKEETKLLLQDLDSKIETLYNAKEIFFQ